MKAIEMEKVNLNKDDALNHKEKTPMILEYSYKEIEIITK